MFWCRTPGELGLYSERSDAETLRAGKSLAVLGYVALTPQRTESRDRSSPSSGPALPGPKVTTPPARPSTGQGRSLLGHRAARVP